MNKLNNTKITGNINRNSQLTANNGQSTYLNSSSYRSRLLPGLLMFILGAVFVLLVSVSSGYAQGPDNCPNVHNRFQTDSDRDGIGDLCDESTGTEMV